jgi:hypothetical protein
MNISIHKEQEIKEYIAHTKRIIDNASNSIEKEFSTTKNDRISCIKSILHQVNGLYVPIRNRTYEIYPEVNTQLEYKIESMKNDVNELHELYAHNKAQPPEEEKEKLLNNLIEIKELINMIKISES